MQVQSSSADLPAIPEKRYFTIGEVSGLCDVKQHILRYWEQEFDQLAPVKRRGNRRYYRREDVATIREIRTLLYDQGYTISGARQILSSESPPELKTTAMDKTYSQEQLLLSELEDLVRFLTEDI